MKLAAHLWDPPGCSGSDSSATRTGFEDSAFPEFDA